MAKKPMKVNKLILMGVVIILLLSLSGISAEVQTDTKDKYGSVKTEDSNNVIEIELDITGLNPTKEYAVIEIKNIGKKLSGGLNDIMVISPIPLFNIQIESNKYKTKTIVTNQSYTCSGSSYGYIDTTHFYCNTTYSSINNATLINETYDFQQIINVPAGSIQKTNVVTWSTSEVVTEKEKEVKTVKLKSKSISSSYGYGVFMYYIEAEDFIAGLENSYKIKVTPSNFGLLPIKYTVCIGDNKDIANAFCLDPTITNSRTWTTNADFTNGTILSNMTTSNDRLEIGVTSINYNTGLYTHLNFSNVIDYYGNLTFTNSGGTFGTGGKIGDMMTINNAVNNQRVLTGNDALDFFYTTDASINVWVNPLDLTSPYGEGMAIISGSPGESVICGGANDWALSVDDTSNKLDFAINGNGGVTTRVPVVFAINTWYMVTMTHNETGTDQWRVYIDGVLYNTTSVESAQACSGVEYNIGNRPQATTYYHPWHGKMDEMTFWNGYTLTQDDITSLYNSGNAKIHPFVGSQLTQSQLQDRQSWTPQSGNTFINLSAVVVTTGTSTVKFRYNSTNASLDTSAYTTLSTNGTNDLTFNLNANNPIFYEFLLADTSGTETPKVTSFTVNEASTNSAPIIQSISSPINDTTYSTSNVTISVNATDSDGNTISYYHFINGIYNSTNTTTINFSDGAYTFFTIAGDGLLNSSNSSIYNFTIDTVITQPPSITNFLNFSQNNQSVYFTWDANTKAEKYILYKDGSNTANTTGLNYNFTSLTNNTQYIFNISAFNSTYDLTKSNHSTKTTRTSQNNDAPTLSNILYATSGSTTIYYLQTLDHVNFTATDSDGDTLSSGQIQIIKPDGTTAIIYNSSLISGSIYGNETAVTLNAIGNWTLNVSITDGNFNSTLQRELTVVNVDNPTTIDGYFAYNFETVPTTAQIDNITGYEINLIGHQINYSNFESDLSSSKTVINYTNVIYNDNTFLIINFDTTDYTESATECSAVTNLSTLTAFPYVDAIQFIVIRQNTSQANSQNFTNNMAECIRSKINNKFPIYSQTYYSGLDSNYVSEWNMPKIDWEDSGSSVARYINREKQVAQDNTSLTRIYSGDGGSAFRDLIKTYKLFILNNLRGSYNGQTNITNKSVAELNNQDFVVFNNQSSTMNFSVNHSNASGKDFWDFTNKKQYNNVTTTQDIEVGANNFTLIYVENLDKLVLTDNTTSTLYYSSANGVTSAMNYTGNQTQEATLSIVGAYDGRVELWNPNYGFSNLDFVTYEQLEYTQIVDFNSYGKIIIAKGTNTPAIVNTSLQVSKYPAILNKTFGYVSVADYDNTNSTGQNITDCTEINTWETNKQNEMYNWTDLYGTNVFVDGFDIGFSSTPGCFEQRIKRIADNTHTNKQKELIFNTYTIYETIANYGDYVMRESCFSRWDGTVGSPTYSYENFGLMVDNANYMETSNIPVICMAFGDVNDYEKMGYDYMAFAVMYGADGSNSFRYGQPNFQTQREIRVPSLGNMLQNTWVNNSATDLSRRYANGIVHINPLRNETFSNGKYYYFDNGATINDLTLTVKAQVYASSCSGGTGIRVQMFNGTDYIGSTYDIDPCTQIGANQFDSNTITLNISNEYQEHGHYYATFRPIVRGEATGTNIYNRPNTQTGVHSWYDSTANNPPVSETDWTAYGRSGTLGNFNTTNYHADLFINYSNSASLDTSIKTINVSVTRDNKKNITITSTKNYTLETWTNPLTFNLVSFNNLSYWNGTGYNLLNLQNTTDCDTLNPTFATTSIAGKTHKACYKQNSTDTTFRIATPHLTTQVYQLDTNSAPTTPTVSRPTEAFTYTNSSVIFDYNSTDTEGDDITYYVFVNSLLNTTDTVGQSSTITFAEGYYNMSVIAGDTLLNSSKSIVYNFSVNYAPTIQSARITPTTAYTNNTLIGYCNATDSTPNTLSYNWRWYNNSIQHSIGTSTGGNTQGVEFNAINLTSANTTKGQTWILSCQANDGNSTSSYINSTGQLISNSIPSTPTITQPSSYQNFTSTNVTFLYNSTDIDGDALTYYQYLNGTLNQTISSGQGNTSLNFSADGDYSVFFIAFDSTANSSNSTTVNFTIDTTAPVIISNTSSVVVDMFNVTLNFNENANATFYYSNSSNLTSATSIVSATYSTIHSFQVEPLVVNVNYYYKINGSDPLGNQYSTDIIRFLTTTGTPGGGGYTTGGTGSTGSDSGTGTGTPQQNETQPTGNKTNGTQPQIPISISTDINLSKITDTFSDKLKILNETTIWDGFIDMLGKLGIDKEKVRADITFKNYANPFVLVGFLLVMMALAVTFAEARWQVYLAVSIGYIAVAFLSMFMPVILLGTYILSILSMIGKLFVGVFQQSSKQHEL